MRNTIIFIVHRGKSYYLQYALGQVRYTNPGSRIILLGDKANQCFAVHGIEHYEIEEYFTEAGRFEKVYDYMSSNPEGYELFCFQRWFIISEFCEKNMVNSDIWCLDSDAMIYTNLAEYAVKYLTGYETAACGKCGGGDSDTEVGPQYTWFKEKAILKKLTLYVKNCFSKENERLRKKYRKLFFNDTGKERVRFGGVTDMMLLSEFFNTVRYRNLSLEENGYVFEDTIRCSEGFEMGRRHIGIGAIKKIKVIDGLPVGTREGKRIIFRGLHFQGTAKPLMYHYYTGGKEAVPGIISAWGRRGFYQVKYSTGRFLVSHGLWGRKK